MDVNVQLYYSLQRIPRYLLIGGLVVGFAGCVLIGPAMFITTP